MSTSQSTISSKRFERNVQLMAIFSTPSTRELNKSKSSRRINTKSKGVARRRRSSLKGPKLGTFLDKSSALPVEKVDWSGEMALTGGESVENNRSMKMESRLRSSRSLLFARSSSGRLSSSSRRSQRSLFPRGLKREKSQRASVAINGTIRDKCATHGIKF
jgi:hypothetical protein